jgi:hypothetical protein
MGILATIFIWIFLSETLERVNVWLLFNSKWAIFQLYHGENKLHSEDNDDDVCFEPDHHVLLDFCNTSLLKQLSEVKICSSTQTHIPDSELTGLALTP